MITYSDVIGKDALLKHHVHVLDGYGRTHAGLLRQQEMDSCGVRGNRHNCLLYGAQVLVYRSACV
jgi:hypothetical protein